MSISIPSLDIKNREVVPKPTEHNVWDPWTRTRGDRFPAPDNMYDVVWWSDGPKPGETSQLLPVLLGHTQIHGYGVFNNLGRLKPGQVVTLESKDGKILKFIVIKVVPGISKSEKGAFNRVLKNHPTSSALALGTCSGEVSKDRPSHKDNTLVFLRLAESKGK